MQEQALKKSKSIPDISESHHQITRLLFEKNNISLLQKYQSIVRLRTLQKQFYSKIQSPRAAYLYFKELNRQGRYSQVKKLYNEYKHLFLQNQNTIEDENDNYTQRIYDQIQIAEEYQRIELTSNQNNGYLLPGQTKKNRGFSRMRAFFYYSIAFMILFGFPFNIQIQDSDDDSNHLSEDEQSSSRDMNISSSSADHHSEDSLFKRFKRWIGFEDDSHGQPPHSQNSARDSNIQKSKDRDSSKSGFPKKENLINRIFNRNVDIQEERNIKTRFSDVLGIDEFKEELTELVDYLKNPQKYAQAGAKLPKGILLVGPPGTGKTLLARALAGEANCAFFYKTGSEFDEMFVGVGASRVRELFKKAREKAPSIIFIDEIDSVAGTRRSVDPGHSRDTVNQILSEMDGFKQSDNVIVIGATNFEQAIDPAIKRPGRFDKIIHVPLPDIRGRQQIFEYYLKNIKYNNEVRAKELARQTSGFTGADIQNMVNLAILNAIKNEHTEADNKDFDFALDRISMGVGRKNMLITDKDKLITAYHEGGHTLTAYLTEGATPLHKVTILPRGGALGFTSMIPETDRLNYTKKSMIANIDVAMGGRAAEELLFGNDEITTGCSSDLSKATEYAYQYVKMLGMLDDYSLISIQSDRIKTSDKYDYEVDQQVQKILKESYQRVKTLLKTNETKLQNLASELIKNETLTAEEIKTICIKGKLDK